MKRNPTANVVFLLDVDNTLLDNDRIIADLRSHLEAAFGGASAARYWAAFEALRAELGYADYLGALQRYRSDTERGNPDDEQGAAFGPVGRGRRTRADPWAQGANAR